jgi:hypothetical protein
LKKFDRGLARERQTIRTRFFVLNVRWFVLKRNAAQELESLVSGEKKKKSKSELPESVREG